jgi:calpain-15
LISGHAYSVISLHEITHDKKSITLLKLRNPWGKGEWEGDWSDKSPLWTPELRAFCGSTDEADGTFFISFADYFHNYAITAMCVDANPDFHHNHIICDLM